MKTLYINSRLAPLLVAASDRPADWLFSQGERWLYLSPSRLGRLAHALGLTDERVDRLVRLVRRHSPCPERYCRRLGLPEVDYVAPDDYPPVLCPRCDRIHTPHPLDADAPCPSCREELRTVSRHGVGRDRDLALDQAARSKLRASDPDFFLDGVLSPNHQYNAARRLDRDWDKAANRILMGLAYRTVAREFDCSVGLLHKKVQERRHWENN